MINNVTMIYDGVDFSDLITITNVTRNVGNTQTLTSSNILNVGELFQKATLGAKTIKIDFFIYDKDRNTLKHKLASYLLKQEPARLTLSDESDKYYNAIIASDISMSESANYQSNGSLTFEVPDGVAWANEITTVKVPYDSTNAVYTADITNNGTLPTYPKISIDTTSDNGYYGLSLNDDYAQLGNPDEQNMQEYTKQSVLLDEDSTKLLTYADDASAWDNLTYKDSHILRVKNDSKSGTNTLKIPITSTDTRSTNDYLNFKLAFEYWSSSQQGSIEVAVYDDSDTYLYGYQFYRVGSTKLYSYSYGRSRVIESDVPSSMFTYKGNSWDLTREDNKIGFYNFGKRKYVTDDDLSGKIASYIKVTYANIGGTLPTIMGLIKLYFRDNAVNGEEKVINTYQADDNVILDYSNYTLVHNSLYALNELAIGSDTLSVPSGQSTITINQSSWSTNQADITLEFRERYL